MFSGLTSAKNRGNTDFGEQMLNTVAGQSLRHLFTRSGKIDVSIRCYPSSKLLQGSLDSFKMQGSDLLIRNSFAVHEMSFETDAVAIDIGAALRGQITLRQPTQAVAQVTLTEAAINQAFQADLVRQRTEQVDHPSLTNLSGGEPVSFKDITVKLLPEQKIKIQAKADLPNQADLPISVIATLSVERRRRLVFGDPVVQLEDIPASFQGLSEIVTTGFMDVMNGMVDLDRFDLDGVLMRINRLETQDNLLVFSGYAQIEHFPKP